MGGSLSLSEYQRLLPGMENAMRAANVTTPLRAAMWVAQIGHESVGLRYMEEIASGDAYEWRRDLGNIYAGDGRRYKGSGPIQLTGRNNFRAFTNWANSQGHTSIDFEANPHLVREDPKWGFLAASWYWVVARPQINSLADRGDLEGVTRAINGGLNGLADRRARYNRALQMGSRILPGKATPVIEKILDYSRDQVSQDTFYNCGPASAQTIIQARTKEFYKESVLGSELGTHRGGTDYIGSFPPVLNKYIGGDYKFKNVPAYLDAKGKDELWDDIVNSIDAEFGVVANIVAPPSNYPKAVAPSTISPAYGGGVVYHYIAVMGYRDDGQRKLWIADSGFSPYGYFISLDQLASLLVPKGYAYATVKTPAKEEGLFMSLPKERQEDLANKIDRIYHELTHKFQSRYEKDGVRSEFRDTLVGYELEGDRKVEDIHANMLPEIYRVLLGIQEQTSDRKGK